MYLGNEEVYPKNISMAIIRIGIVDDHDLVRFAYSKAIGQISSEFVITMQCSNGIELIENLSKLPDEKRPHIILTDLNMPVMDGYETTVWVKKHFEEIAVIIVSTRDDLDTVGRLNAAGASGFLAKNFTGDELFEAIKIVANGGTYLKLSEG
jgi:DNA-binding NarL/FixJ family response regulator